MQGISEDRELMQLFEGHKRQVGDVELFFEVGGSESSPPVVLLHGYPQTHVMWHRVAPRLAETHRVVVPDLRGYGASAVAPDAPDHATYSKRAMAEDVVRLMAALGHERFAVVGHDRGGRVGYRLALDHPERVSRLCLVDIVPTAAMWSGMDARLAMKVYHWMFLAQPAPLPEMLIAGAPDRYLDHTLASWTKAKDLSAFDPRALARYHAFYAEPERRHATCEDYRAGATIDRLHDEETLASGRRIEAPTLVVWGAAGIPADGGDAEATPLAAWSRWCSDLSGRAVDSGHFVPEENPEDFLAALEPFLAG